MKNTYDVKYLRALDTPYVLLSYAFSKTNFYQLNVAVTTTLLKEFFSTHLIEEAMLITPFPKLETIHGIAIPMPYPPELITANVYAVGKGPITLIDTGPKIPGAFEFVRKKFQSAGLDFKDIERIIITHGHVDHFGLAVSICEAAGHRIDCFLHAEDTWRVSSEDFHEEMWSKGMEEFMTMVDMPEEEIQKMRKHFSSFRELADPLNDVFPMEDGDEFVGDDYHLTVIHTPGHSPGTCCLYESRQKVLFSGDHIIKHITPNPLIEINRDKLRDPQYQSLKAYLQSLDKLNGLDVRFVFPGHGEYIKDLPGIISTYRAHHQQRIDLVWDALKKQSRPMYHLIHIRLIESQKQFFKKLIDINMIINNNIYAK